MHAEYPGLNAWLDRFGQTEMPVLASAVKQLNNITQDDLASAQHLAEEILKDANLSSKVLKIANSATYNAAGSDTSTISRAVVLLGFETVRSISVSAMLVDKLARGSHKNFLMEALSDAFHAAVQARGLCEDMESQAQEEVFVAALLANVGEMVFWSENGEEADKLAALRHGLEESQILNESDVLGVSFASLSQGMADRWSLGKLLKQMLDPKSADDKRVEAGRLGVALSNGLKKGRDSKEFRLALEKAIKFSGLKRAQLVDAVEDRALDAKDIALASGIKNTKSLDKICAGGAPELADEGGHSEAEASKAANTALTSLDQESEVASVTEPVAGEPQVKSLEPTISADNMEITGNAKSESQAAEVKISAGHQQEKLLAILFKLLKLIQNKANLTNIFRLSLEGMVEGVGLKRAVVAMLDTKTNTLHARYILGDETEGWLKAFCFPVDKFGVLGKATANPVLQHLKIGSNAENDEQLVAILNSGSYFIGSICIGDRVVGIFYADGYSRDSSSELTEAHFSGFQHIVQQVNMGLLARTQA